MADPITLLKFMWSLGVPPRERLQVLGRVQAWVDEQRSIALAQLDRQESPAPAPSHAPASRAGVYDADFEEG